MCITHFLSFMLQINQSIVRGVRKPIQRTSLQPIYVSGMVYVPIINDVLHQLVMKKSHYKLDKNFIGRNYV